MPYVLRRSQAQRVKHVKRVEDNDTREERAGATYAKQEEVLSSVRHMACGVARSCCSKTARQSVKRSIRASEGCAASKDKAIEKDGKRT